MTSTPPQTRRDGIPCPDCLHARTEYPDTDAPCLPCPRRASDATGGDRLTNPAEMRVAEAIGRQRLDQREAFIAAVDALRAEEAIRQIFRDLDPDA